MPSGQDASAGTQGGGDDQILSEAMDVFNQTAGSRGQQGQESTGMPGDNGYGDSDVLGQTAGNSMPGTSGSTGGDSAAGGSMGQDTTAAAEGDSGDMGAMGSDTAAAGGDDTGAGGSAEAGGGMMGQDETYGSAGYPDGTGTGPAGTGDTPGSPGYGGTGGGGGAMTTAERVGALEGKLDNQLAVFDGMILNKQQTAISEREENARESGQYGAGGTGGEEGSGDSANGESAPLLTAMARGTANSNAGGGMMPNQEGDNRKGDFGADPNQKANIPADIPDGSDDDVVARQLREAAMKETDPVLRDKLWDEYRKYKKGVALRK